MACIRGTTTGKASPEQRARARCIRKVNAGLASQHNSEANVLQERHNLAQLI